MWRPTNRFALSTTPSWSGEDDFDAIYAKITDRKLPHWADPRAARPGEINRNDGGRGVYFRDPGGHFLEIITRPYGSGAG